MPTPLRNTLNELASNFAAAVVAAIRAGSLEDILAESSSSSHSAHSASGPRRAGRPAKAGSVAAAPAPAAAVGKPRPATKKPGRLPRRSAADIAKALDRVVALVKKKPGLRAEQIRVQLALDVRELPRVLKEGLDKKRLTKKGEKRATEYTAK
jgi:hypothetical protein